MYTDIIFGPQLEFTERTALHADTQTGVRHLHRRTQRNIQPNQPITLQLSTGGPRPFDRACCWWSATLADQPEPIQDGAIDMVLVQTRWDTLTWGYVCEWHATLPALPANAMLRYHMAARIAGSEHWIYADTDAPSAELATEFAVWIDPNPTPVWAAAAIVYHIFVDRFTPGAGRSWHNPADLSGFYGGTLRGVIEQLENIHQQGYNTLWLSPVFASPSHHGYDTTDYFTVEPRLGSNADLIELFEQAHARNMRIILDLAANHCSNQHPFLQDAQAHRTSPYHEWFRWQEWPKRYDGFFNVPEMPEFNLKHPAARAHLLEVAQFWLQAGADGFRLDYANGPTHDFWADFRRTCRTTKPDCWLFGEVIHNAETLRSYVGLFDGTLDFLLAQALRETFAQGRWDLAQFEAFLTGHEHFFPADFMRPAFLDNHDMNRFLFLAQGDTTRLILAALVLFTLTGPPIIYYGTEVGMTQERPIHGGDNTGRFEDARLPMRWGAQQNTELHQVFQQLARLRSASPILRTGTRRVLHLDAAAGSYAYIRESSTDPHCVLVALNLSSTARQILLAPTDLPRDASIQFGPAQIEHSNDQIVLHIPARSGVWIA